MPIKSFLDLEVYRESFQLSLEVEGFVRRFPSSEKFLLADQLRRASRAVPALISEGYAKRESVKDFRKYLKDALGETNEMINHLSLEKAFGYIDNGPSNDLINRYHVVGKKLSKLKDNWQKF